MVLGYKGEQKQCFLLGMQQEVWILFSLMTCAWNTVHLGYNNVSIPQSQIAISKLSLYPTKFTKSIGIIDFMGSNRDKQDIVLSRIVITKVDCRRSTIGAIDRCIKNSGIILIPLLLKDFT